MAVERTGRVGKPIDIWDERTNAQLSIVKSVDITDECPRLAGKGETALLDFALSSNGVKVKFSNLDPDDTGGWVVVLSLSRLNFRAGPDEFDFFAKQFGLMPETLLVIVNREAPKTFTPPPSPDGGGLDPKGPALFKLIYTKNNPCYNLAKTLLA